jgi:hypothetical protein
LEDTGLRQMESLLPMLPGARISQDPNFQVTSGQQYESGVQNSVWNAAPDPFLAAQAGLGAARGGFAAGAGSGGVGRGGPVTAPAAPSPWDIGWNNPMITGSGEDQGNAPGSPGAYAAWYAWAGNPVYAGPNADLSVEQGNYYDSPAYADIAG